MQSALLRDRDSDIQTVIQTEMGVEEAWQIGSKKVIVSTTRGAEAACEIKGRDY